MLCVHFTKKQYGYLYSLSFAKTKQNARLTSVLTSSEGRPDNVRGGGRGEVYCLQAVPYIYILVYLYMYRPRAKSGQRSGGGIVIFCFLYRVCLYDYCIRSIYVARARPRFLGSYITSIKVNLSQDTFLDFSLVYVCTVQFSSLPLGGNKKTIYCPYIIEKKVREQNCKKNKTKTKTASV